MKKHFLLNFDTLIACIITSVVVYYLLLHDNFLNGSISFIIAYSQQLAVKQHLIVLGLLPVYIAAIIFGAAVLGFYLGSTLQYLLAKILN